MFNHSSRNQNVTWTRKVDLQVVEYRTLRDIEAGEELCISYGSHLWFEDADALSAEEKAPETEEDVLRGIEVDDP